MTAADAAVCRNSACPCGSGRRFKDCHGALGAGPTPAAARAPGAQRVGRTSAYRPRGPDWDHLSEAEREACGVLMERALKRQQKDRLDEAAEAYAAVLAIAPDTHDALHMLGAISLRQSELAKARRYITAAMALRPPYREIEHNFRILRDMERAERARLAQERRATEALCQRALPALVELALRPTEDGERKRRSCDGPGADEIHIIAGVCESTDRADWLVARIAEFLAPERPTIWARNPERYAGCREARCRKLAADIACFPRGGRHVFIGLDLDCHDWIERSEAQRVVVFCPPSRPSQCLEQLRAIARDGARPVQLVFGSSAVASKFGLDRWVVPPPVDPSGYRPDAAPEAERAASVLKGVAVGIVGRNWPTDGVSAEGALLSRIAAAAGRLELYDPGQLRSSVGGDAAVRCHARSEAAFRRFVQGIDVLLHASGQWWLEGDGRELFAAMAAGIPVLCRRSSIYAEYIDDAADGLLYDDYDDALRHLTELRRAPARAAALGHAARAKIDCLLADTRMASLVRGVVLGHAGSLQELGEHAMLRAAAGR